MAGLRQKQCGQCGLWRYPQELSEHMVRWQGFTARGKPAHQMAPLCLKCEARSKTPNAQVKRRRHGVHLNRHLGITATEEKR